MLEEEGLEAVYERHARLARGTQAGLKALGFQLYAQDGYRSNTVTSALPPPGLDVNALRSLLNDKYGVVIAGGQGKMTGKMIPVGHRAGARGAGHRSFRRARRGRRHRFTAGRRRRDSVGDLPRILVADPLAEDGLERLRRAGEVTVVSKLGEAELIERIPDFDALVVRSETRVTESVLEAGRRLRVVGRAGVGVDNIDVPAATRKGIVVVNAPRGNIVAAAEHTIALLFAVARWVPFGGSVSTPPLLIGEMTVAGA